jgi:hypothetical protein
VKLTYVRVEGRDDLPRSVEPGRDNGFIYLVPGHGYVSQSGFYSETWSAWTLKGSFLGEFTSRKQAGEELVLKGER